jgi:transcriptional regulator with XRE-family HTH domain
MKPIYLRSARIKRNLTQAAVAKRAGIEQHTISKLEGTTNARPPYATHTAIARALDIDPDRLRFGPDPNYHGPRNDRHRVRMDPAAPTRREASDPIDPTTPAPDDAPDSTPAPDATRTTTGPV